ncbi:MBL fold metallo-hydrolase, partial [Elusimicrobiota bacterium]
LVDFCKGAGLLIHNARYTDEDYPEFRGRGHSSPGPVLDLALRAGVRSLILYHLDPSYPPEVRRRTLERAQDRCENEVGAPECVLAEDGTFVDIS